jgi:hypothetical protein
MSKVSAKLKEEFLALLPPTLPHATGVRYPE